jgi:hypothetical protein
VELERHDCHNGTPTVTTGSGALCPKKSTEEIADGMVTGGTSQVTNAGDTFHADVCVDGNSGKIKLANGTVVSLYTTVPAARFSSS